MPVDVIVVTPGKSLLCGGYNDENVELKLNNNNNSNYNHYKNNNDDGNDDDMLKNGPFTITTSSSSFQKTKKDHRKTLADIIEEEETDTSSSSSSDDEDDVMVRKKFKLDKKKKLGQKIQLFRTKNKSKHGKNDFYISSDCGSDSSTTSSTYASTIISSSSSSSDLSSNSHSLGQRLLRRIHSSQQEQEKTAEGIVIRLHHRHSFSKDLLPPLCDLSTNDDDVAPSLLELPQGLQPRESVKETGKKLNVSKSILSKYQTRTVQTKPIPITLLERLSARLQASQQYVSESLSNYCQMLGLTDKQALYWQEKMNCTSLSW